jgi:hypothetical protein
METCGDGRSRSRRSGAPPLYSSSWYSRLIHSSLGGPHEITEDEVGPAVGQLPVGSVERLGILVTNEASAARREPRWAGVSLAF